MTHELPDNSRLQDSEGEKVSSHEKSILGKLFAEAGVASHDEEKGNESHAEWTTAGEYPVHETYLFSYGQPVLYRKKAVTPGENEGEKIFTFEWTMIGESGLLNVIKLKSQGQDTLELGIGNPNIPDQYAAVRYTHGFFDHTATILPDFEAPITPIITITPNTPQIPLERRVETQNDPTRGKIVCIYGTSIEPGNLEFEAIIFPQQISSMRRWITKFEFGYEDATTDSSQPWRHWFRDMNISYKYEPNE